jgi:hypothetical protein
MMRSSIFAMAFVLTTSSIAAELHQPNVTDFAWLEGSWEGPGIDGAPAVEVYSAPAGGQIVGHFRQLKPDGTVMFYELITIDASNGQLRYRLKHFNPDLTGWEEKGEVTEFPLSAHTGNRWEFSGLTLERERRDRMTMTVVISDDNGGQQTLKFQYRKKY